MTVVVSPSLSTPPTTLQSGQVVRDRKRVVDDEGTSQSATRDFLSMLDSSTSNLISILSPRDMTKSPIGSQNDICSSRKSSTVNLDPGASSFFKRSKDSESSGFFKRSPKGSGDEREKSPNSRRASKQEQKSPKFGDKNVKKTQKNTIKNKNTADVNSKRSSSTKSYDITSSGSNSPILFNSNPQLNCSTPPQRSTSPFRKFSVSRSSDSSKSSPFSSPFKKSRNDDQDGKSDSNLISTATSALRRLHFKSGRNATRNQTRATMTQQNIPKVIVMGSSSASETTINTSTDSANTIITTMTNTDGDLTEDSLDRGDSVDLLLMNDNVLVDLSNVSRSTSKSNIIEGIKHSSSQKSLTEQKYCSSCGDAHNRSGSLCSGCIKRKSSVISTKSVISKEVPFCGTCRTERRCSNCDRMYDKNEQRVPIVMLETETHGISCPNCNENFSSGPKTNETISETTFLFHDNCNHSHSPQTAFYTEQKFIFESPKSPTKSPKTAFYKEQKFIFDSPTKTEQPKSPKYSTKNEECKFNFEDISVLHASPKSGTKSSKFTFDERDIREKQGHHKTRRPSAQSTVSESSKTRSKNSTQGKHIRSNSRRRKSSPRNDVTAERKTREEQLFLDFSSNDETPQHGSKPGKVFRSNRSRSGGERSPRSSPIPPGPSTALPDLRVDFFSEPDVGPGYQDQKLPEKRGSVCLNKCLREVGASLECALTQCGSHSINVTTNPLDGSVNPGSFGRKIPQATIVVQQPSLSLDSGSSCVSTILLKNGNEFVSNCQLPTGNEMGNGVRKGSTKRKKREENMKQLLDVANTLTSEEMHDFEMRYGSPHHSRSQSVKTPGRAGGGGRPQHLCLPQQRSRVASMPNTGVEEEYYRLRHFSITGKGIVNRGDSLKSRSNTSMTSSNSSTEHLTGGSAGAAPTSLTSALCGAAAGIGVASCPGSARTSVSSRDSSNASRSQSYRVVMLGAPGVGKSSLVGQFMTSEHLHAYDTSIDDESGEKTISVLLAGEESELTFIDHPFIELSPERTNSLDSDQTSSTSGDNSSHVTANDPNRNNSSSHNHREERALRELAAEATSETGPQAYCVVYSCSDKDSLVCAEKVLATLWTVGAVAQRAVILVANKADLVRSRAVTTEEGKSVAIQYDCKFIETSVSINHNVDELLVGLLTQIRLKLENPERSRDLFRKRSCSRRRRGASTGTGSSPCVPISSPGVIAAALTSCGGGGNADPDNVAKTTSCWSSLGGSATNSPKKKYRGSRTSASLKVRGLLGKVWARDSKSKSCENLHVL